MWESFIPAGSAWLPAIGLGAIVAAVTSIVAAYRKWKSGDIEDDGTLLTRAYDAARHADSLRAAAQEEREALRREFEEERRRRWHAEDQASVYLRQLIENGIEPKEVA